MHYLEDNSSNEEEVFFISAVKTTLGHSVVATCIVNQKHNVVFELDTGASCNILPLANYVKATDDEPGQYIQKTKTRLTMHNNTSERSMGKVMLFVERSGHNHRLCFYVIRSTVMPILGKDACIGMQLIKILDCDAIHKVAENATAEISVEAKEALNNYVLRNYSDVFEGLGQISGDYEIQTNLDVLPSVQPPHT